MKRHREPAEDVVQLKEVALTVLGFVVDALGEADAEEIAEAFAEPVKEVRRIIIITTKHIAIWL